MPATACLPYFYISQGGEGRTAAGGSQDGAAKMGVMTGKN